MRKTTTIALRKAQSKGRRSGYAARLTEVRMQRSYRHPALRECSNMVIVTDAQNPSTVKTPASLPPCS